MNQPFDPITILKARQRDMWIVSSAVILTLAVGVAASWPSLASAVEARFGAWFPRGVLLGELLLLIALLLIYMAREGRQMQSLVTRIVEEGRQSDDLSNRLSQTRSVLEASARVDLNRGPIESMQRMLREMSESVRCDRVVLYRLAGDETTVQRDLVHPSTGARVDRSQIEFEDALARVAHRARRPQVISAAVDLQSLGITAVCPPEYATTVALPLTVEQKTIGLILLCNPFAGEEWSDLSFELVQVLAGYAAGMVKNLRVFRAISEARSGLEHSLRQLSAQQKDIAEVEAITTLNRIVAGMVHAVSGPLTALEGYAEVLARSSRPGPELKEARDGLHDEVDTLRRKLQAVVDFTTQYRVRYELLDVGEVLDSALAYRAAAFEARNITVLKHLHPNLPPTLIDPLRIRQVFFGVLGFVEDSLRDAPQPREVQVKILPNAGKLRVVWSFKAAHESVARLSALLNPNTELDPFHQANGLALSTVTSIVRTHFGNISVDAGSDTLNLLIELPIRRELPARADEPAEKARENPAQGQDLFQALERIFGPNPANTPPFVPVAFEAEAAAAPAAGATVDPVDPPDPAHKARPGVPMLPSDLDRLFGEFESGKSPEPRPLTSVAGHASEKLTAMFEERFGSPPEVRMPVDTPPPGFNPLRKQVKVGEQFLRRRSDLKPVADRPSSPGQLRVGPVEVPHALPYLDRPPVDRFRPGIEQVFTAQSPAESSEPAPRTLAARSAKPSLTQPLLDPNEVKSALRLFDE